VRCHFSVNGIEVRVASIDDLIAMKRAANRPKDREHILELAALKAAKAD
jgi:predicted nucleotidyltransferase